MNTRDSIVAMKQKVLNEITSGLKAKGIEVKHQEHGRWDSALKEGQKHLFRVDTWGHYRIGSGTELRGVEVQYDAVSASAPRWRDGMRPKTLRSDEKRSINTGKVVSEIAAALDHKILLQKERLEAEEMRAEAEAELEQILPDPNGIFESRSLCGRAVTIKLHRTVTVEQAKEIQRMFSTL